MSYESDWVASTEAGFRHYDPATVAKVVDSLPEPVLLFGPLQPSGHVHELAVKTVQGEILMGYALAFFAVAIVIWIAAALATEKYPRATRVAGITGISLFFAAIATFVVGTVQGGSARDEGRNRTGGAYVVTASRVVLLDGAGGRADIPASSVGRIARRADGTLTLSNQRGYTILEITPGTRDQASIDAAYDVLGGSFRPSAPVREAVAR